jgi:hypothetical protein
VLGILGVVVLVFSLGVLSVVTLPMSVAAWIMGAQGRKNVASGQTTYGDGMAHAGVILGIVGVILGLIALAAWIALLIAGVDWEQLRRDLEEQSNPDVDQAVWMVFGR